MLAQCAQVAKGLPAGLPLGVSRESDEVDRSGHAEEPSPEGRSKGKKMGVCLNVRYVGSPIIQREIGVSWERVFKLTSST